MNETKSAAAHSYSPFSRAFLLNTLIFCLGSFISPFCVFTMRFIFSGIMAFDRDGSRSAKGVVFELGETIHEAACMPAWEFRQNVYIQLQLRLRMLDLILDSY